MYHHPVYRLSLRKRCASILVTLLACYDMQLVPAPSQIKYEVTQNLACGGMIGKEKTINKDDTRHLRVLTTSSESSLPLQIAL
jgi:hypothetical protein